MRRIAATAIGATALLGGLAAPASAAAAPAPQGGPAAPQASPAGGWGLTEAGMTTPLGEFELPTGEPTLGALPLI